MLIPVLLFLVGLILLIKGGDWFVDGATGIAERFHLPDLLIGATVVSIGTTLPEVMVSATSAVSGHSEIAYGNAIGSIICNTSLIAAITIAVRPGKVSRKTLTFPICFFFIAALFYAGIAYTTGSFTRWSGILLLLLFALYMVLTVRQMTSAELENRSSGLNLNVSANSSAFSAQDDQTENKEADHSGIAKEILLLIVGAALIAIGANLLVDNGTLIAEALGVPESVIALTFVALGTSLPELVTAITSLIKGHSALSLGNIIGANLFNLVLVCGISITLNPFDIPISSTLFGYNASLVLDLPVMFAVMLILTIPALLREKLSRVQGVLLLVIYASYCVIQFAM
ncbi:MAG: calcium/sodium antiporter [Lachnospiraceae bacterium]|nr:calcium/sodium antiporter [Lachnospiraceae bacterium]